MKDDKITELLEDIKGWLIGIWVAILCLMVLTVFSNIASAESPTGRMTAVVSFNDAEHLVAISDSIVGVCDTNWVHPAIELFEVMSVEYLKEHGRQIITCRELVCVTVVEWIISTESGLQIVTPGTAIITWREVKP